MDSAKDIDINKVKKQLQKDLDAKRYEHTIGVAYTAACLAMRYGISVNKAYIAGLLHDCAKCFDNDKKISLCKKYGVKLSDNEKNNTSLIHAKLGAEYAKVKYEIDDIEIADAISFHTTGKADMSMLEKIVFSADYIEPHRKQILGLDEIRTTIFMDIDEAVYLILLNTIKHLKKKDQFIDDASVEAFEFYKKMHDEKASK